MRARFKLPLLILFGFLCFYRALSQDMHFSLVDPPKGDQLVGIADMTQDQQGYLWLATFNGLNKYDGHKYTFYRHNALNPNSIASNRLERIFADKNGILWLGTFGSGLDRFDPATNTFTHYRHQSSDPGSLIDDRISAITQDRDGIMWFGTNNGLDRFDPKSGRFKHFINIANDPNSLSNNQVRAIYEDRQGTIWVGTGSPFYDDGTPNGGGGLNKLDKKTGKFTRYMHNENDSRSLIDNRVQAIFEDSRGTLWIGTAGDGLHTMDRTTGSFERHTYDPAHPEKLSRSPLKTTLTYVADHIAFINEDNSGKIWIGTLENGIKVYDPFTQKTSWYGKDAQNEGIIAQNQFWSGYKSRDGILWIAPWQTGDLYKVNPYQSKLPYYHTGYATNAFAEDGSNTLWIATYNGLVHQLSNGTTETFYIDKNITSPKNAIFHIVKDNENKLWVTNYRRLHRFDPSTRSFTEYDRQTDKPGGVTTDIMLSLKKGEAGKLWVGTNKGLDLVDTKTGIFKHFLDNVKDTISPASTDGFGNKSIQAIEIDKNNNIWAAAFSGLYKLDQKTGHLKKYLNDVSVFCLLNDSNNNLWAATINGLFKYNESADKFSVLNMESTSIYWITEGSEKTLWLNTNMGIVKLDLKNNETNIYGTDQGVNAVVLNSGYTRHNGEILYGDSAGYFALQPEKLIHRTPAPNTIINRFLLADRLVLPVTGGVLTKPVINTKEIKLNHTQTTFSFGFTNIDFVGEEGDTRNFYMLENYDGQWRKASSDETVNYYVVPPGKYMFKVKSINTDGVITEKHISVIISPPWWQTWWAYIIFALLIAGSIWAFIYYRSLQLIKEKRVLEHKVHVRTEEVLQQKEEIEAQRDSLEKTLSELKTTQTQLIQSEKMASLGELTAGIAHEIQNPLNFVNNFSEVNTELIDEMQQEIDKGHLDEAKAIAEDIKENQQKINLHGKRADGIVKGMLQHSRSSSGLREQTDINVLADEYLRLSYHGLRAKDKSFNAEMETDFDKHIGEININPQDIGRAILNLLTNAFYAVNEKKKLHPEGYKPMVTVGTKKITLTSGEPGVEIFVKDNGNGIPQKILDKIYQPFFTTKPTGQGTGLGLSMSYDIIKAHDGELKVETKEGEFTEFRIELPS